MRLGILDDTKNILLSATEDMTAEELRRVIADTAEKLESAEIDVTARDSRISELESENKNLAEEVDRLKEENGRLFRERLGEREQTAKTKEENKTVDELIKELENEIDY